MSMTLYQMYVLFAKTFPKMTNDLNADVSLCIIPFSYVYFSSYRHFLALR